MDKQEIVALLNTVVTPTYQIEVNLGMPKTTLQKALTGERKLPKKWALKLLETYKPKLEEEIVENNKPENKAKIEAERNRMTNDTKKERKQPLAPQECETKHKLWKKGDPPENSNAFYFRYGCFCYDELEKQTVTK